MSSFEIKRVISDFNKLMKAIKGWKFATQLRLQTPQSMCIGHLKSCNKATQIPVVYFNPKTFNRHELYSYAFVTFK